MKENNTPDKGLFTQANKGQLTWSLIVQILFMSMSICTLMEDNVAEWKVWFASIGGACFLFLFILTVYNLIKLNKKQKK